MTRTIRVSARYAGSFFAMSALLVALAAAPAAAGAPVGEDCAPSLAFLGPESPAAALFGSLVTAKEDGSIDGPGALADCTAKCANGYTVTCSGSTCSAVDRDCPNDEQGYCTGSDSGTKVCPSQCEVCTDPTPCEEKNGTSCSGSVRSSDCSTGDYTCGSCFCDGTSWVCTL